ncbi:hypothetical protein [Winogradskyella sp. MH6]|uniref:hypothetical protein n=1 Tax=Winogradskyella sp. MH6 TaxID=2929510 RepID=UPI001FB338B9|nr:hypothetical protein [Winogradskyella sp. MH6]
MFDGFKLQLVNSNHILNFDGFDKTNTFCHELGHIHKTVYHYKCLSFHHFSEHDKLYLYGSFHKFHNNGQHNYNQFSINNFISSVSIFLDIFSIEAKNCIIKNIEYGVNIETKHNINILLNNLLLHKNQAPLKPRFSDFRFEHQRYHLKVYNKSEQYLNLVNNKNILRFEMRFERMIKLNQKGINTLADLLSNEHLTFFNNELVEMWNNILMFDYTIKVDSLNTIQRNKLKDFCNPSYWQNLKPNRRDRQKKYLKNIILKYSDKIQSEISIQIIETLKQNCVIIND